eukprot:Skav227482  [mRNA]  locus=scaffold2491:570523:573034:+ [translate_table: standard]
MELTGAQIIVDEYSRTNVDSIFAIGVLRVPHGHVDRANVQEPGKPDYDNVPSASVVPQGVAPLGDPGDAAAEKYGSVDVYVTKWLGDVTSHGPMRIARMPWQ